MGKVILVPPSINFETHKHDGTNNYGSGADTHMVQGSIPNAGGPLLSAAGGLFVNIPRPRVDFHFHDPMLAFSSYYSLGNISPHRFAGRRTAATPGMFNPLTLTQVNYNFWDYLEIEELARTLVGDLLVQIDEKNDKWNFGGNVLEDHQKIIARIYSAKSHCIRGKMSRDDAEEMKDWMSEHCSVWDLFVDNFGRAEGAVTAFIRDDKEAVHFKLRWYGG